MNPEPGHMEAPSGGSPSRGRRLLTLAFKAISAACILVLFAVAGTIRWPLGWVYLAVVAAALFAHQAYVAKRNPGLIARRNRLGEGTPRWDLVWNMFFWPLMASIPITAAMDVVRFHGTALPLWLWPIGALLVGGGIALNGLAMATNPHFEGTVRIQKEIGHRVVDAGPYQYVRHPGYLGLALWALGTPFVLSSRWACLPACVTAGYITLRTALEDRFLHRNLEGYSQYAGRVRHRLVPGIW